MKNGPGQPPAAQFSIRVVPRPSINDDVRHDSGMPPLPTLTYGSAGSDVKEKEKKREAENHENSKKRKSEIRKPIAPVIFQFRSRREARAF
jgi:hypothetical protein